MLALFQNRGTRSVSCAKKVRTSYIPGVSAFCVFFPSFLETCDVNTRLSPGFFRFTIYLYKRSSAELEGHLRTRGNSGSLFFPSLNDTEPICLHHDTAAGRVGMCVFFLFFFPVILTCARRVGGVGLGAQVSRPTGARGGAPDGGLAESRTALALSLRAPLELTHGTG